jgi:hypothetical protein
VARVLATIWLFTYAALVAGVPILDAATDHSDRVVAHWEDANDSSCPPLHDPGACLLCQQVGAGGRIPAERQLVVARRAATGTPSPDTQRRAPRSVAAAVHSPRAPPVI